MTGEVISHFEILDTLGEGGMGVVYKARDTKLDRIVAVKLLPRPLLRSDADRERFSLEARAAGNLSHPNICTVFEYDEVDGQALIAMECIEGPSLSDRLSEGRFTLDEALAVTKQIASGLAAAHAKGVVHRDIKPGNVLMTENGVVKISDFGLAKLVGGVAMTQTGVSVGTVAYMSPEQTRGEEVGPPTDIWALGTVLYQMLRGDLPFPHQYPTAVMYAIVHEEPQNMDLLEAEHGSEVTGLIRRCLSKDPSIRPTAAEIAELLGADASASRSAIRPVVKPSKLRWRPAAVAVAVVALLALVVSILPNDAGSGVDFAGSSIAILPVDASKGSRGSSATTDSTLKLTLDGLLQTVSGVLESRLTARGAGSIVPFGDILEHGVSTAQEATSKLGADYAVKSRITGYDPVPTVEFTLVRGGDESVGESISVPVLVTDLQDSYEAALRRIGGLLGVADSILVAPSVEVAATTAEAFQLYTRAQGLLQQRSNVRSLQSAEEQLRRALELDPDFAAGHAALGQAALYRFEATKELTLLDQAERHCDEAIRLEPNLIGAYVTLGTALAYTGKHGQAQRALETALNREPFNSGALLALAEVQEDLGDFKLAEQTYKRAVESNPDYWGTYNRLGKFYVGRSEWQKAADQYQRVADLAPSNSIGYRNLGAMMWYLGRIDEARRSWELSLEIEPSYSTYNNLGTMHFYERNYRDAAAAYEKALEINDKDHRVWGHLATAYFWMRADRAKYLSARRKAAEMAEQWLAVSPSDREVKAELAGYYAELGEDEKSRRILSEFGRNPDTDVASSISFQVGAAWEELGDRGAALAWIRDALEKGYPINEITHYPGLEALRADPAFIRILETVSNDSPH